VLELGVAYATLQCAELLARGAPGIHFYTLNRSPATRAILSALRLLRPWVAAGAGIDRLTSVSS
jgi:methylenetetrahydrofolate reductase (NADH)